VSPDFPADLTGALQKDAEVLLREKDFRHSKLAQGFATRLWARASA